MLPEPRQPLTDRGPRSDASLLEMLAARVATYRHAMRDIRSCLRPDYCMGCRIAVEIMQRADCD